MAPEHGKKDGMEDYDDVLADIVDRAQLAMKDGMDMDEAVDDAIDSGMFPTAYQMAVADHFGTLDVESAYADAYGDFYDDVYSELSELVGDDYDEDDDDDEDDEE